jgi:hypothetical protein
MWCFFQGNKELLTNVILEMSTLLALSRESVSVMTGEGKL